MGWLDNKLVESLLPCAFCGGQPKVKYIGNEATKKRRIEVSCIQCRATMINGAIRHGFDRVEEITEKYWNARPEAPLTPGTLIGGRKVIAVVDDKWWHCSNCGELSDLSDEIPGGGKAHCHHCYTFSIKPSTVYVVERGET